MQENRLKPCPFCGCEMVLTEQLMSDRITVRYVPRARGAHKRGCQLEFASGAYVGNPTTKRGAMLKWNRRA